ncbi:hypothetical protein, partial [Escherichia coli]|uniref:hypothetical protein n=1 Tax=Escherichia coli TaxID=562 RepID=UPI001BDCE667
MEKFETTFFQLLDRVEKYCEVYLRVPDGSSESTKSKTDKACEEVLARRKEFDEKGTKEQLKLSEVHVNELLDRDIFLNFFFRSSRVLQFVCKASISDALKISYIGILRETLLPTERILYSHYV